MGQVAIPVVFVIDVRLGFRLAARRGPGGRLGRGVLHPMIRLAPGSTRARPGIPRILGTRTRGTEIRGTEIWATEIWATEIRGAGIRGPLAAPPRGPGRLRLFAAYVVVGRPGIVTRPVRPAQILLALRPSAAHEPSHP